MQSIVTEIFDQFADDVLGERSARPLIIIGASKVDVLLYEILRNYLLPKRAKAKEPDELLEGDRPLATFSARIKVCFRLGLIDSSLCRSLETLRSLRNSCAHSLNFDMSKSPWREYISNLHADLDRKKSFRLTQHRFFESRPLNKIEELQCLLLTLCVVLEAIREKITVTTGISAALRIASI